MKIMLFNTLYFPHIFGGAEKSVQILAEGLVDLGHDVVVVSTAPRDDVAIVNKVHVYYVRHRNLYWGGMPNPHNRFQAMLWHIIDICNPYMYSALDRIVSLEQPDMIHTNMMTGFSAAPWIVAKKHDIPVVHTLREYNLICERMSMFHKDQNCSRQCISCRLATAPKKMLTNHGFVDHVVGLSNFIINRHKELKYFTDIPSSRIFNGIQDVKISSLTVRGSSSPPLRMLYLGRIDKPKGVQSLLDLIGSMDGVELHLGGEVLDQMIKDRISAGVYPPHIKFLGFIKPEKIFDEYDVLIVPSLWHEPFGRVVIEAYQHGKPVIASNRGGLPEIVIEGQTGFLYDPDKPEELRAILHRLIEMPGLLGALRNNLREFLGTFELHSVLREYENIYETFVKR